MDIKYIADILEFKALDADYEIYEFDVSYIYMIINK